MATVTIDPAETPSQGIVRAANQVTQVTDARGRVIGVKKIGALDRMRMFEAVGAENSKNEPYLGYASLAFHVGSIDGDPVTRPGTKAQLEALIQRLDDDGMNAVAEKLPDLYGQSGDAEALLKNASGTPNS
jgi:hypothetical protein